MHVLGATNKAPDGAATARAVATAHLSKLPWPRRLLKGLKDLGPVESSGFNGYSSSRAWLLLIF